MNKLLKFAVKLIFIVGVFACFLPVFSQNEKRIEEIRKIYQETNQKITECEENGETSTTFLTELTANKNGGSYPAVGIYKTVVKFYYTFGDREKNPYPNRLMKIIVTTNRSSRTENAEFLFNEQGKLIFYFEKKDEIEKRIYFTEEKPIRILEGEKTLDLKSKSATEFIKQITNQSLNLRVIFQNSLE